MVLSEVILWLRGHVTLTHWADVITILKVCVDPRLVPHYLLMFLLTKDVVFAVASYSTVNSFEI